LGLQHVPSGVITSLELVQGVTHLPLKLICPFGQGSPVKSPGHGLSIVAPYPAIVGRPVFWQTQTYCPASEFEASFEPCGHVQTKTWHAGSLTIFDHSA
jgi:hypothetical protein